MHAAEREQAILNLLEQRGFIAFRELEKHVDASPATLRRDLERMSAEGRLTRVRGGVKRSRPRWSRVQTVLVLVAHRVTPDSCSSASISACVPFRPYPWA